MLERKPIQYNSRRPANFFLSRTQSINSSTPSRKKKEICTDSHRQQEVAQGIGSNAYVSQMSLNHFWLLVFWRFLLSFVEFLDERHRFTGQTAIKLSSRA